MKTDAEIFVETMKWLIGDERGWQARAARWLEVSAQTVSNWSTGRSKIPTHLSWYLALLLKQERTRHKEFNELRKKRLKPLDNLL